MEKGELAQYAAHSPGPGSTDTHTSRAHAIGPQNIPPTFYERVFNEAVTCVAGVPSSGA